MAPAAVSLGSCKVPTVATWGLPRVPRPGVATPHTLVAATHSKQRGAYFRKTVLLHDIERDRFFYKKIILLQPEAA